MSFTFLCLYDSRVRYQRSPFVVRQTGQFSLAAIMAHRVKQYSQRQPHTLVSEVDDADFVYLDVESSQNLRRCFRCADKQKAKKLPFEHNPHDLQKRFNEWFRTTLSNLRYRRAYPSTFLALPRINKVYSNNMLSDQMQPLLDDVSIFGIEGSYYNMRSAVSTVVTGRSREC